MYVICPKTCCSPESPLNILAAKTRASLGNPIDVDSDGLLVDVDVQPIDDSEKSGDLEDKRRDINEFFHPAVVRVNNGIGKKYSTCKLCL